MSKKRGPPKRGILPKKAVFCSILPLKWYSAKKGVFFCLTEYRKTVNRIPTLEAESPSRIPQNFKQNTTLEAESLGRIPQNFRQNTVFFSTEYQENLATTINFHVNYPYNEDRILPPGKQNTWYMKTEYHQFPRQNTKNLLTEYRVKKGILPKSWYSAVKKWYSV